MRSIRNSSNIIKTTIILAIVVLIMAIGFDIWRQQNNNVNSDVSNQTQKVQTTSYTDSSKLFSFQYPTSWSVVPYVMPGSDGNATTPDWSKVPQPITLQNKDNKDAEIRINATKMRIQLSKKS